ncbi:TonB family protein [Sulfitobacter pacificus]|uniref:TonB family protein n=1 Tax=Sulfitobacter pacificus TaxID=1499314 RepID=UPI0031031BF3
MIRSSTSAKIIALGVSTVVLATGMQLAAPRSVVEMEGGGTVAEARIGTAFEDMSAGTLTAEPVEDAPLEPTPPEETPLAEQVAETPPTQTDVAEPVPVEAPLTATAMAPEPLPAVTPQNTAPVISAAPDAVVPQMAPSPPVTAPVTPPPLETIVAQAPDETAPPLSIRPKRRDPEKAAKVAAARPKPQKQKLAKAAPQKTKAPRGNAQRNNTKGTAKGNNQKAKAKSQGQSKQASAQSGNAAASNYPGKVMRRIARVPKPRVSARGTTVVSFSVGANGSLSSASVARSSGSATLDKAALRVIRKASPFPKPPRGARRTFSIKIKGR